MGRTKSLLYTCYALLPLASVFFILAVSWLLAAIIEIYCNNLTMFNTLNRFTTHSDRREVAGPPYPGATLDNTFWFVHLSDIHLSKFRSYGQKSDLVHLCSKWLPRMRPSLVLLTGDLTDAKDRYQIGSMQYKEEWTEYAAVMQRCMAGNGASVRWLDVRGNHDTFAVEGHHSSANMFETHGLNKQKFKDGVHHYVHNASFGSYAFIGVDMAPSPGPARPFNFFGIPHDKMLRRMEGISRQKHNGTVWYGHYPTSVTTHPHRLRRIFAMSGVAYLCGHLHTLLGLFPQMQAVHSEGIAELELGDWKQGRLLRVGVFDHDMFSFADVTFGEGPIVVFTNPVDARYIVPGKTHFTKSWNSTHVRILIFHSDPVERAEIFIDGNVLCKETHIVEGVLHVCRWDPTLYMRGVHQLILHVFQKGRTYTHTNTFSLDGTRPPLSLSSVLLILTDFCTMLRIIFIATSVLTIAVPYIIRKYAHTFHVSLIRRILVRTLPQLLLAMDCDSIIKPLLLYNCHLSVGPFSIGYFVPGQLGASFSFGLFTGGTYIEEATTYLYVALHLLWFNSVTLLCTGEILQRKSGGRIGPSFLRRLLFKLLWILVGAIQLYSMNSYRIAYGFLASSTNIIATWSLVLFVYLLRRASSLTAADVSSGSPNRRPPS